MEGAISAKICSWWGFSLVQDSWDLMHAVASISNTTTSGVRCMAPRRRNVSPADNTEADLCRILDTNF